MNVLSLFDGMSCGQIALQRASIYYDNYFASEIDKYAIKITQKNYPNTIQLGDVNNWINWHLPQIDLLIGGSPCQGFSIAGAGLNFADPRSRLFFRYVDCLRWYKPKWFLLENVKMKKEWQDIISGYLGVQPIKINSALVSAQNRERLYWTNIQNITQPKDKCILLKDIIEDGVVDRDKSYCIDANYYKGGNLKSYKEKSRRQLINVVGNIYPSKGQNGNVYSLEGKSPSLSAGIGVKGGGIGSSNAPKVCIQVGEADDITWRKLTPLECERLQTVDDNYTEGVSNTQRYKMLGNGWTVDVIAHIFSFIIRE